MLYCQADENDLIVNKHARAANTQYNILITLKDCFRVTLDYWVICMVFGPWKLLEFHCLPDWCLYCGYPTHDVKVPEQHIYVYRLKKHSVGLRHSAGSSEAEKKNLNDRIAYQTSSGAEI